MLGTFLLLAAGTAQASLILNGDFESVDNRMGIRNNQRLNQLMPGRWDVYGSLPGWFTESGRGIEVQASGVVVPAHSGNHYIELDSHPNSTRSGSTNSRMSQDVQLDAGNYILRFWYRPRTNTVDDNLINAMVDGTVIAVANERTSTLNQWREYTALFTVNSAATKRISFEAGGAANQAGGFIDSVSLTEQVPEPGTFALIGTAIAGLAWLRRRSA